MHFSTAALCALSALLSTVAAAPVAAPQNAPATGTASGFWQATIQRQGVPPFANASDAGYQLFRNVKDFGAKGDGSTDDTVAINSAFSQAVGSEVRCGQGCDSRTTQPAVVYFPPGTYMVSKPILPYYYTQMIGDALDLPVIKATANFDGMAVIDVDPYVDGVNWHTNQNNFFRMVANFVIDISAQPADRGAGIHWQVAQATSLQNIRFEMSKAPTNNAQKGIFMDNGSGGFMTDLTFNGGGMCAFLGSQQFTTRNLTFNDCQTAIFVNWDWQWAFKSVTINNAQVGIDMASANATGGILNQTVGSVVLLDSKISNTKIGVNSSYSADNVPITGGSLLLNNVDFSGTPVAVQAAGAKQVLAGNTVVSSWAQGHAYLDGATTFTAVQGDTPAPNKPDVLLGDNGYVFERSKPQYETVDVSKFVSIKSKGAKGDGKTEADTDVIQSAIDGLADDEILYLDHGAYLITKTLTVPSDKTIRVVGEHWPMLMATGDFFSDASTLKPAIQVGANAGDSGNFEMSNVIVSTKGPVPGATLMQWNLNAEKEKSGLFDVHFRVAGYAGSELTLNECVKNPNETWSAESMRTECEAAGLLFHAVKEAANIYVENCWFWVADHDLDNFPNSQIDIFNGRGVLIESEGASWWYGTASEHNVLYNYQLNGAKNVFMSQIQTETPYYQGNPDATVPFKPIAEINDPDYSKLTDAAAKKAIGLRVVDSSDFLLFGGGLYSFFENYQQSCVPTNDCQANMISIEGSTDNIHLFGVSTKASVSMIDVDGESVAKDIDNRNNFAGHIIHFSPSSEGGGDDEPPSSPEAPGSSPTPIVPGPTIPSSSSVIPADSTAVASASSGVSEGVPAPTAVVPVTSVGMSVSVPAPSAVVPVPSGAVPVPTGVAPAPSAVITPPVVAVPVESANLNVPSDIPRPPQVIVTTVYACPTA